jgi:hypothetical protein
MTYYQSLQFLSRGVQCQDHCQMMDLKSPSPESLNDMIRNKRKAGSQRVCQPCRLRKVKCDYGVPCRTCVKRDYPMLFQYASSTTSTRNRSGSLSKSQN